ncbi:MAG TPA: DNA polymerase I [Stellaceae bacterium]|nr:DNA polymerase I [Stellaceae bacterium]
MSAPRHVYLIDGSGYIFRAYHALPPLTRADGTPIGAALGFANILWKFLRETDADHIAVVFDAARTTFRNRIYEQYKAHRPEPPPDLIPQFKLVRDATDAFNVCRIERPDYEADDLIATYARRAAAAGAQVTIVSSDKDLMQLVSDRIGMFDPIKQRPIGEAEVREKFGVGPDKVVDVQALCGDSVDNVPGVPGIGVKTAAELINIFGDLETLLARAPEIKQPKRRQALIDFAEQARISKRLVKLDEDAPLPVPLESLEVKPLDHAKLVAFLKTQGFRALLTRVEAQSAKNGVPSAPAPPTTVDASEPPVGDEAVTVALPPDFTRVEQRYELIQDLVELDRWIAMAQDAGVVAMNTETTSINAMQAELVGVSLAIEPGVACYIPLGHRAPAKSNTLDFEGTESVETPRQIPTDLAVARLKPLLEDDGVLKVGQNIKYDVEVLSSYGIAVAPIDDTMLISFVLEGGMHGHGLDELATRHFGHDTIKYKDVAGSGKAHVGFAAVPLDRARDYAAEDADITLRLHRVLKPQLLAQHRLAFYETVERPLVRVVADMERAGICVDRTELNRLSEDFARRLVDLENEIHKLAGHPFNIASTKQLGEVLFDELGLSGGKKMKTGAYGTDAAVLEQLALTHDLPARVLDWRQLAKLKSTYTDALVEEINPKTGRVHTNYALAGAVTGRLSSTEPNLQNIPIRTEEGRKIRRAFVSAPGHRLISADYSQIELRLAAEIANVEPLKEAFRSGSDIHALTASEVFGVPMAEMTGEVRRRAKAINFGIIYGMSAFGLAQRLQIPQSEAADYIKAYFARFPGIRAYMDRIKVECREKGFVETLFGRRCYIPGIKDGNAARRGYAEREAINAPLQGTAADIIKRAMARIPAALAGARLKAQMLLQVHDELVFEAPEDEVERTEAVVKDVMEGACAPVLSLSVPLVVETGAASNWEEAH